MYILYGFCESILFVISHIYVTVENLFYRHFLLVQYVATFSKYWYNVNNGYFKTVQISFDPRKISFVRCSKTCI